MGVKCRELIFEGIQIAQDGEQFTEGLDCEPKIDRHLCIRCVGQLVDVGADLLQLSERVGRERDQLRRFVCRGRGLGESRHSGCAASGCFLRDRRDIGAQ